VVVVGENCGVVGDKECDIVHSNRQQKGRYVEKSAEIMIKKT
jgi:hypothetical protein